MTLFRTFVAVEVGNEVKSRTAALVKQLQRSEAKVSWTKPENLHLTLKFLGDTPDAKIPDVCRVVANAAARTKPLTIAFRCASAFPRVERPRTVWIGVEQGAEEICALQADIEEQLLGLGFPRERRQYTPHLTVGRVRLGGPTQAALGELLARQEQFNAGTAAVTEVLAMASFLDAGGPTYQVLGRLAPFGS